MASCGVEHATPGDPSGPVRGNAGAGRIAGFAFANGRPRPLLAVLLLFAAKYQPTLHLGPSPAPTIGASWGDMKREHYGNFSVAYLAISSRKAAKGNLLCSPCQRDRARAPAPPNLAARTSCIGIGRWHPLALAFGFHLSAEALVSLRFRLIGLVCVVLLISLALAGMTAYSNASRSVRTEMRAAFLVGRQTIESAIDRLQNARDPSRDLELLQQDRSPASKPGDSICNGQSSYWSAVRCDNGSGRAQIRPVSIKRVDAREWRFSLGPTSGTSSAARKRPPRRAPTAAICGRNGRAIGHGSRFRFVSSEKRLQAAGDAGTVSGLGTCARSADRCLQQSLLARAHP